MAKKIVSVGEHGSSFCLTKCPVYVKDIYGQFYPVHINPKEDVMCRLITDNPIDKIDLYYENK